MKKSLLISLLSITYWIFLGCAADFFGPLPPEATPPGDENDAIDIVAGSYHTCMLLKGQVRCWGDQNINGYRTRIGKTRSPASVRTLSFMEKNSLVKQITAGLVHTCVLFDDNSVRCWGQNNVGQLGVGNTTPITQTSIAGTDIMFAGMDVQIKQIDAGNDHTCALSVDNKVFCWGSGSNGKLGNNATTNIGDNSPMTAIPTVVGAVSGNFPMIQDPVKVVAGANHTCVSFTEHDVVCWGLPSELGNNGATAAAGMTGVILGANAVTAMSSSLQNLNIKDIVSGSGITCILTNTNKAVCWGVGAAGQLGYGCGMANSAAPTSHRVGSVGSVSTMTGGSPDDDAFRISYGSQIPITQPVPMGMSDTNCRDTTSTISYRNYTDVTQIAIGPGASYSCVLRSNGSVHCFGVNIGIHNFEAGGSIDTSIEEVTEVNCMAEATVTTRIGATYYSGGSPLGYDLPLAVVSISPMNTITTEYTPIISRRSDPVNLRRKATWIGAGESHVCALLEGNQIKCWGNNCFGQLGYGGGVSNFTGGGANQKSGAKEDFQAISSYETFPFPF